MLRCARNEIKNRSSGVFPRTTFIYLLRFSSSAQYKLHPLPKFNGATKMLGNWPHQVRPPLYWRLLEDCALQIPEARTSRQAST